MTDKNGITIEQGQYIQIIGAKVKNDNGIYIVDYKYSDNSFCLKKVKQNGEKANAKYNIFFLDNNSIKRNPEMLYTVIAKDQLKAAAKEITVYLKGKTASEKVYTFTRTTEQEVKQGLYIHIKKPVLFVGHINKVCGTYKITNVMDNGRVCLHLIGAKGEQIADNINGYYQFTPIHLNLKAETMKQLFNEGYIEILNRTESIKGEIEAIDNEQSQDNASEQKIKQGKPKKEIASICNSCKNLNMNCKGMEAVYTGCVCYNKDATLPTIKINREQPNEERTQQATTKHKTETKETKTVAAEQQENTDNKQDIEQPQKQHAHTIKAVYYPINEASARTAKMINSFYDYTTDEATKAYKNHIAEVETLAQQKAEQHPEHTDDIQALLNKYSKKYAEWKNRYYAIECMCPSVMVCGGSNFPVRKKEKQNKARDRHMQNYEYIQSILAKIENIGSQREQIKSSDENSIDKLQAKVDELKADLDRNKAMNKYFRKNKTMLGFESLTNEQATKIDNAIANAYSFDKQPAPSFELASIRNKIKTAKGRIAEIKRLKESAEQNTENQEQSIYKSDVCQVVENTELMRLQLLFDGKPSDDIRSILKSHGFRWSPYNSAWQRQLTNNAKYDARLVLKEIEKQEQTA